MIAIDYIFDFGLNTDVTRKHWLGCIEVVGSPGRGRWCTAIILARYFPVCPYQKSNRFCRKHLRMLNLSACKPSTGQRYGASSLVLCMQHQPEVPIIFLGAPVANWCCREIKMAAFGTSYKKGSNKIYILNQSENVKKICHNFDRDPLAVFFSSCPGCICQKRGDWKSPQRQH